MTFSDQGILGLSFPAEGSPDTVFQRAYKMGNFPKPIFTTFLKLCPMGCEEGGILTLGDEDRVNCGEVTDWADVVDKASHWKFMMGGYNVSGYRKETPMAVRMLFAIRNFMVLFDIVDGLGNY